MDKPENTSSVNNLKDFNFDNNINNEIILNQSTVSSSNDLRNESLKLSIIKQQSKSIKTTKEKQPPFIQTYFLKVKRGTFWSERTLVLTDNLLQYYKDNGEKRFEEKIEYCKLTGEEDKNDFKKHMIILSSEKKLFEDVKIMNNEKYIKIDNKTGKIVKDKQGLVEFIKDFNFLKQKNKENIMTLDKSRTIERALTQKIKNPEKENIDNESLTNNNVNQSAINNYDNDAISEIKLKAQTMKNQDFIDMANKEYKEYNNNSNKKDKAESQQEIKDSVTPGNISEKSDIKKSLNTENTEKVQNNNITNSTNTTTIPKDNAIAEISNKEECIKENKLETKPSNNKIFCMTLENIINNSIKVPLTEIYKTLINEKEESFSYYNNSRISSNKNLESLNNLTTLIDYHHQKKLKLTNELILHNSKQTNFLIEDNLILLFGCLLISLSFCLRNNDIFMPSISLIALSLAFILLCIIINKKRMSNINTSSANSNVKGLFSTKLSSDLLKKKISPNSIIKLSSFINEEAKEVSNLFSNGKLAKEYSKYLISVNDSSEGGLEYTYQNTFVEGEEGETKIVIKRLALKRKNLFLIGEFIKDDLLKLIAIESYETPENIEKTSILDTSTLNTTTTSINGENESDITKVSIYLSLDTVFKNNLPDTIEASFLESLDLVYNYFNLRNFNEIITNSNVLELNNALIREALIDSNEKNNKNIRSVSQIIDRSSLYEFK